MDKSLSNKHGSLPRNKARSLAKKKGHFLGTSKGTNYLFKREGKDIRPLIVFKGTTQHTKRYPLWKHSVKMIDARFKKVFKDKMEYALRTAR